MSAAVGVLVLGESGMLGSTMVRRLRACQPAWRVDGTLRSGAARLSLDTDAGRPSLATLLRGTRYDYVVNCIGVLKGDIDARHPADVSRAIRVNAVFPHEVADVAGAAGCRVLHISSDAVFSGRQPGACHEATPLDPSDAYGMTKALGESAADNVLNLRGSIVGRSARGRGLIEWYLRTTAPMVTGYIDYVWTPVTTVQVAGVAAWLMRGGFDAIRRGGSALHVAPNAPLSKAEFLEELRGAAGGGAAVAAGPAPDGACRRVLASNHVVPLDETGRDVKWSSVLKELLTEFSSRGA